MFVHMHLDYVGGCYYVGCYTGGLIRPGWLAGYLLRHDEPTQLEAISFGEQLA